MRYSSSTRLTNRTRLVLILFMLIGMFLITTSYTDADLSAERRVIANHFRAITLNLYSQHTANDETLATLFHTTLMRPGGMDVASLRIRGGSTGTTQYTLKTAKKGGDATFCDSLSIHALRRDLTSSYTGSVKDMMIQSTIKQIDAEDWIFILSLDSRSADLKNKLCEFEIVARTYRSSPEESGGIYAQRTITSVVSSGTWD